ncbi:hypothetical protein [Demequina salsinemoris]|uniref:hypothetical protein n=1 Tax=Demequina salsinemoris TaxID=577470 RepID=UPI000782BDB2|nr:hypothetical protein [Demequina salsinemoris]
MTPVRRRALLGAVVLTAATLSGCSREAYDAPLAWIDHGDGTASVVTPLCAGDVPWLVEVSETDSGDSGGYVLYEPTAKDPSDVDAVQEWPLPAPTDASEIPAGWALDDSSQTERLEGATRELGAIWVTSYDTRAFVEPAALSGESEAWLVSTDADGETRQEAMSAEDARAAVLAWCDDYTPLPD